MKTHMMNRINSDSAESLTVSQILWIVFTVVLVLYVGQLIYQAVSQKGRAIADCLNDSNALFQGSAEQGCADSEGTMPVPKPGA